MSVLQGGVAEGLAGCGLASEGRTLWDTVVAQVDARAERARRSRRERQARTARTLATAAVLAAGAVLLARTTARYQLQNEPPVVVRVAVPAPPPQVMPAPPVRPPTLAVAAPGPSQTTACPLPPAARLASTPAPRPALDPAAYLALVQRAEARAGRGQSQQAIVDFRAALAGRPGDARALVGLGYSLLESRRGLEATATFRQLLARRPTHGEGLIGLAESYQRRGLDPSARQTYERYLALLPSGPHAQMARRNVERLAPTRPAPAVTSAPPKEDPSPSLPAASTGGRDELDSLLDP